jgi:DUF971 family protein
VSTKRLLPLIGQPDPHVPRDVHLVGRYAVGVTWGDGHGSIYPFERLRRDCPCGACAALEAVDQRMGWPTDIRRAEGGGLGVTWSDGHRSLYPYGDLRALCRCAACTGGH